MAPGALDSGGAAHHIRGMTSYAKTEEAVEIEPQSNVIDLMAALKKSLEGKPEAAKKPKR